MLADASSISHRLGRTGRALLGAVVLLLLAWFIAPEIRWLLARDWVSTMDSMVAEWLHGVSTPLIVEIARALSLLHGTAAMLLVSGLAGAWLVRIGARQAAMLVVFVLPGGMLINAMVKQAIGRARPVWGYGFGELQSYSFPSGHVAQTTLLYGLILIWLWTRLTGTAQRSALVIAAVLMVLLVAASRIVLGLHFVSDCMGAVLEALLWLSICTVGRLSEQTSPPRAGTAA